MLVDQPPGCNIGADPARGSGDFVTSDGRQRRIKDNDGVQPFDANLPDPAAARKQLAQNPGALWESTALAMKVRSGSVMPSGIRIDRSARIRDHRLDPDGAIACVDHILHYSIYARLCGAIAKVDNAGVHCVGYNPASGRIDAIMVEYSELRPADVVRDPGFAADAAGVTTSPKMPRAT